MSKSPTASAANGAILPGAGALPPAVGTTLLVVTATLVAVTLYFGLDIERVSMVFAVAIMGVSALYGLRHGFAAAFVSVLASNFFLATPAFSFRLAGKEDIANAVTFVAAAWLAGTYTEILRERRDGLRALYEGAAADGGLWTSEHLDEISLRQWVSREAARLSAALAVICTFAAAGVALQRLEVSQVSHIFLAGVVASAILFGGRYALVGAVVAAVMLNYFISGRAVALDLSDPQELINVVVFAGAAVLIGGYADRVRHERATIRLVLNVGEQLARIGTEDELFRLLCDTVSRAGGGVPCLVVGADGQVLQSRLAGEQPQEAIRAAVAARPHQTVRVGPWRARKIGTTEGGLEAVVWRSRYRFNIEAKAHDTTIGALIDRCGGALAQMRLARKRAEAEVRMHTERLRNALLASVSHDFRTPLAGVLGASTSLLEFPNHSPEVVRDMLTTIKEQAQRLNRFMEKLIGAARLDEGAVDVALKRCAVWDVVADAWEVFAENEGGARLFDLQGEPDALAMADPLLLRQVLGNVLENAIKFSAPDSRITARISRGDGKLVLDVADEGCGVPPEHLHRIFGRFYRTPDARTGGTGLGLYISRVLVEAQGGDIQALCRPDGRPGLLVRVTLKAAEGDKS